MIYNLYRHNDERLLVIKKFHLEYFNNKNGEIDSIKFNGWKKALNANKVLRTQTEFLFCEIIEEVEFEEIMNEPIVEQENKTEEKN